jgi:hypothetical protein
MARQQRSEATGSGAHAPDLSVPRLDVGSFWAKRVAYDAEQRAEIAAALGVSGERADAAIARVAAIVRRYLGHAEAWEKRRSRADIAREAEALLDAARAGAEMPSPSLDLRRALELLISPMPSPRVLFGIGEQVPHSRSWVLDRMPAVIAALARRGADPRADQRAVVAMLGVLFHEITDRAPRRAIHPVTGDDAGPFARLFRAAFPRQPGEPFAAHFRAAPILRSLQRDPDWPGSPLRRAR